MAKLLQVGEEPPYLTVGTEVSAKYRGAFCEASIKAVKKIVKCKVGKIDEQLVCCMCSVFLKKELVFFQLMCVLFSFER